MELTAQYGYEQVLEMVRQLPLEDEKKLKDAVEKDIFDKSKTSEKVSTRKFGDLKGLLVYMADDFDAPLEDFKDYM
jgi:Protein of unknown function (DUF2281)